MTTPDAMPCSAPRPVPHGGARGVPADHAVRIDLSTNVNPYGAPPSVLQAARAADLSAYPDPTSHEARAAAARAWQCPLENIAFGAGVSELLPALCSAQLRRDDCVVLAAPIYGEYARAAQLCGARVVSVRQLTGTSRTDRLIAALRQSQARMLVVVAPGNPLGERWGADELAVLADAAQQGDALLVIDQSYDAFLDVPLGDPVLRGHPVVVHLRSLTKDLAIAGVRAAYAVGPPGVICELETQRAPWAASAPAQAAAVASFAPDAQLHVTHTTRALRRDVARFAHDLRARGVTVHDTDVHWLLCELSAEHVLQLECEAGVRVRTLDDHDLSGLARIVTPATSRHDAVVDAIADLFTSRRHHTEHT